MSLRLEPQALDPFEALHLILVLLFSSLKERPQTVSTSGRTESGLFLGRKTSLFRQAADAQRTQHSYVSTPSVTLALHPS